METFTGMMVEPRQLLFLGHCPLTDTHSRPASAVAVALTPISLTRRLRPATAAGPKLRVMLGPRKGTPPRVLSCHRQESAARAIPHGAGGGAGRWRGRWQEAWAGPPTPAAAGQG